MLIDPFYEYKNQLMEDLLTNKEIVSLLTDDPEIASDPKKLVYTQVFPYEYIPETIEHGHTFICCDVDIQKSLNKTFMVPTLFVWVFSHKSKLSLPTGGVRTDRLVVHIADQINGSRDYGLGELDLYSVKRFAPINDYQGKVLTFNACEFNRTSPTGKAPPSKRRDAS